MEFSEPPAQRHVANNSFSTVTAAFHHHVNTNATSLAVRDHSEIARELTYGELAGCVQQLTRRLRDEGVLPGHRVPFIANRGLEMVVGIWAILFCGAQYVPLDEFAITDDTIRHVLEETQASVILCLSSTQRRVLELQTSCTVILVDEDRAGLSQMTEDAFVDLATPDRGCYVAYTSGRFEIGDLSIARKHDD